MIQKILYNLFQRSSLARFAIIPLAFALVWTAVGITTCVINRRPVLESMEPAIAQPGDIVVLRGRHFGKEPGPGWIEIAGNRISSSAYLQWSDATILVQLPEQTVDGLVHVHNRYGKSNPRIFANRVNIPKEIRQAGDTGLPFISGIDSQRPEIGKRLILSGQNFGVSRNTSTVSFVSSFDSGVPVPAATGTGQFAVECSERDFDYELWSDTEIRIRIPDGASSGSIVIQTDRGISNAFPVQIHNQPGTKQFTHPATYVLSAQVDITGITSGDGGMLHLRIPLPLSTPAQRNMRITASSPRPYMENFRGAILHQLENLRTGRNERVSHSFLLTNHAILTDVRTQQVRPWSDTSSPLYLTYTAPDYLVPSDNPAISAAAATIAPRERNPWLRARAIYLYIVENFSAPAEGSPMRSAVEALETKTADAYERAILFCALARAAGIPAVPVAGILVDAQMNTRPHWWAEFSIENFGWIPVDPALGAGLPIQMRDDDAKTWYFGNLDNRHIAWSRGWNDQRPLTPGSTVVYRPRSYALQPIWEESAGNLRSYTSFWTTPAVTGIY